MPPAWPRLAPPRPPHGIGSKLSFFLEVFEFGDGLILELLGGQVSAAFVIGVQIDLIADHSVVHSDVQRFPGFLLEGNKLLTAASEQSRGHFGVTDQLDAAHFVTR